MSIRINHQNRSISPEVTNPNQRFIRISSTGALIVPVGNNSERNNLSTETGMFRFNTDLGKLEIRTTAGWETISSELGGTGAGGSDDALAFAITLGS